MRLEMRFTSLLVSFVCLLSIYFITPNFREINFFPKNKVNLGLDLQGGSQLSFRADFQGYFYDHLNILSDHIRSILRKEGIAYSGFKVFNEKISFSLKNNDNFYKILDKIRDLDHNLIIQQKDDCTICVLYNDYGVKILENKLFDQSIEIIRMRIDKNGTLEPTLCRQGDYGILLQMPGIYNPEMIKKLVGQTARLSFHKIPEQDYNVSDQIPFDQSLVYAADNSAVIIERIPLLTGDHLTDAYVSFDNGQPIVGFTFNNYGANIFAKITKNNLGARLAIVMDNKLLSAPQITVPIKEGKGIIQGNFSFASASELALLLRAGAMPARLDVIEEKIVGPSLGEDSMRLGVKAGYIGFVLVCLFMIMNYGLWGIFSSIALFIGMLNIFALLSIFSVTLTLPGIAGIILTIGMSVDANVLIYERIREEYLLQPNNIFLIVKKGFDAAFFTIVDANVTTLISAFMLYVFGIGAIRGFAITLSIGIMASMFSSIIITKLLIDLWLRITKPKKIYI